MDNKIKFPLWPQKYLFSTLFYAEKTYHILVIEEKRFIFFCIFIPNFRKHQFLFLNDRNVHPFNVISNKFSLKCRHFYFIRDTFSSYMKNSFLTTDKEAIHPSETYNCRNLPSNFKKFVFPFDNNKFMISQNEC